MANQIVSDLGPSVTEAVGAMQSATVLIDGIQAAQAAAIAAALANGATAEELAPLTDLNAALKAGSADLSRAVAANSTPPVEPPAEPARRNR